MKSPRNLHHFAALYLGMLFLIVLTAYTLLVIHSFMGGLEEAAAYDLHLAARDFEILYKKSVAAPLPRAPRLKGYLGEKNLPIWLKENFSPEKLGHGKINIFDRDVGQSHEKENYLYLIFTYDLYDGNRLYLIKTYNKFDDIPEAFKYSDKAPWVLLTFGIGFILLTFFVVQFLFRKVFNSVEILSEWAHALDRKQLEKPRPDFNFNEIDHVADIIQNAVDDLNTALTREHRFLRNASHELRTPIAVLQTNMDLLKLVIPSPGNEEKIIYKRIQRAVENMHQLTETLLWLNRKKEEMPLPEPVAMDKLIKKLVRDNQYLLTGKTVEVCLEIEPVTISLSKVAFRIALGNLIRNAFQYTDHGIVDICLSKTAIIVTNTNQILKRTEENQSGFGLGLLLVKQICQKLNIAYDSQEIPDGHKATLNFTEPGCNCTFRENLS